jgi:hypothetical protein
LGLLKETGYLKKPKTRKRKDGKDGERVTRRDGRYRESLTDIALSLRVLIFPLWLMEIFQAGERQLNGGSLRNQESEGMGTWAGRTLFDLGVLGGRSGKG